MKNVMEKDGALLIDKAGIGEEISLISPFYPFNHELIKLFLQRLKINNQQYLFSNLNFDKNNDLKTFHYHHFLTFYKRIINGYSGKKINLIAFGIFSNLFLELTYFYKERIKSIIFIEPDFNDVIFNKIFEMNEPRFFKFKFLLNFYLENFKYSQLKSYLSKVNFKYLYYYYRSYLENRQECNMKDLIDDLPIKFDNLTFYQQIMNQIINNPDKNFMLTHYQRQNNGHYVLEKPVSDLDKLRIREILTGLNLVPKISIYWKIMARETWPLPQILKEMNIQLFLLNQNVFNSFYDENDTLIHSFDK